MLQVENLYLRYGEAQVLSDLGFSIMRGKTLAIIGPSGCGKSSLLLCLAGLQSYDSGSITLNGEAVEVVGKQIGLVLQDNHLFPWLTARRNMEMGLIARGAEIKTLRKKVDDVAEVLGISDLLERYPKQLSGGEKQRVGIGRVLCYEPQLLLLDEPSSALDAMNKEKFQDLILNLKNKEERITIIVTHSIEEAVYLGDEIMVMQGDQTYKILPNTLPKGKHMRSEVAFFNQCTKVRRLLEGGDLYHEEI